MSAIRQNRRSQNNWLSELWQTYVASGDITALFVTIILLLMPALALNAAEWPIELGMIVRVTVMSLVFGYFLSRSRYNELYALIVSGLYGLIVVSAVAAFSTTLNPF